MDNFPTVPMPIITRATPKDAEAMRFELFTGSRSEGNIRLYRRHGYEITRRERLSEQVTLVLMSKSVASRIS
jgi:hypothetical protein